jgi:SAM-dependent methyltransferase
MDNSEILEKLEILEKFIEETPCEEIIKVKELIVEQLDSQKIEGIDDSSIAQRLLNLTNCLKIISSLPPEKRLYKLSDIRLDNLSIYEAFWRKSDDFAKVMCAGCFLLVRLFENVRQETLPQFSPFIKEVKKYHDFYFENRSQLWEMAVKTRQKRQFSDLETNIIANGYGIDIGCSAFPISANAVGFDLKDGDANEITKYVNEQFDWVYSAHCLEHMHNPYKTLSEWWKLVKTGGHMIIYVPDEDIYEQGHFPSIYNSDHKTTFTIKKEKSWSPVSVNVEDLIKTLPNANVVKLELQDDGYDYSLLGYGFDQTIYGALAQICFILNKKGDSSHSEP